MRYSASEAVIAVTNGMVRRASPSYLHITVIGTVAQLKVLMINICLPRFLAELGDGERNCSKVGGGERGGQGVKATPHLSDFPLSVGTEAVFFHS